jgi:hypothetical protein
MLSVDDPTGDTPQQVGGTATPGALGDYAVCTDDGSTATEFGKDSNGAIVQADTTKGGGKILTWRSRTSLASISDGTSNTFLVGEKHVRLDYFGQVRVPPNSTATGDGCIYNGDYSQCVARSAGPGRLIALSPTTVSQNIFGSYHSGICQFVMCDGSVQVLSVTLSGDILRRLARRDDGEAIPSF